MRDVDVLCQKFAHILGGLSNVKHGYVWSKEIDRILA